MDIRGYNRAAWDQEATIGSEWTTPVTAEQIAAARQGQWTVVLTETKAVPRAWFPPLTDKDVLCLASGGGQQGPLLAAAGARVTVLDNSPVQLAQDRGVAEQESLSMQLIEGDMADLSGFADESFDLVFHPTSNLFVPDVRPVWQEAYRVLRLGGVLLAGFLNPLIYLFDDALADQGELKVRHAIPYADVRGLTEAELEKRMAQGLPLEFGHTLADQVGGQLDAGFVLTAMYEDRHRGHPIAAFIPTYLATRAVKLPIR